MRNLLHILPICWIDVVSFSKSQFGGGVDHNNTMTPILLLFLLSSVTGRRERNRYSQDTGQTHEDLDNIFGQQNTFPDFHEFDKKPEHGQVYENFNFGQENIDPFGPKDGQKIQDLNFGTQNNEQENLLQEFEKIHFGKKKVEHNTEADLGQQFVDDSFLLQDDGQQQNIAFPDFP